MNVLVLGVSGMLGSMVFRLLGERPDWRVTGTARSPAVRARFADGADIRTDVAVDDLAGLAGLLAEVRPEVVINCIGVVKQAAASHDPLLALPINALFPHQLARLCGLGGIRLVHISTDCVFSGRTGSYRESDVPDAEDLYGRSKLLGEVDAPNAITLRTSIVGPEPSGAHGFGLLEWFLRQPGPVKGYARAIFSGLTTDELTRVIADFVIPRPELSGVYQVSAAPISKFDLLHLFAAAYGRTFAIEPDETLVIDRSLDSSRFRAAAGYAPPDWPAMVAAMRSLDPRPEGKAP
jgi:dTDP-4-dehydrorhamnose reductase